MRDLKTRRQPLRRRGDQAAKCVLVPIYKIFFRRLALDSFLAAARRLFRQFQIFDHVLRRLRHHPAAVVEALAPGATTDLVKIPRTQDEGLLAVEFA